MYTVTIATINRFFTTELQEIQFEEECQARFFASTRSCKYAWCLVTTPDNYMTMYVQGKEYDRNANKRRTNQDTQNV